LKEIVPSSLLMVSRKELALGEGGIISDRYGSRTLIRGNGPIYCSLIRDSATLHVRFCLGAVFPAQGMQLLKIEFVCTGSNVIILLSAMQVREDN
jgi:hypothetical protein